MNLLSERELRMNQQAAMAAASVLSGVISDAEYTSKREQIISEL